MFKSKGMMGAGLVALSTAMALSAPAFAQDEDEDVITVTGSLIQRDGNLVEASPVTTIGAEEFDVRGTLRVEDMINTLPQAFGAQGANLANGSTGTASLNLRGLGASRTLVLLNGRRMPYGSINIAAPDVNFIPAALIEQVDVLTGGASATYGADAVAGVVNFKLADDFEGFRLDGNWSIFQHDNSNSSFNSLLSDFAAGNPSQYRVPEGNTWEGQSIDVTAMFGGQLDSGRGGFTGYVGYQNTDPILQDAYDYSHCALASNGDEFTCAGSSTNQFSNILDFGANLPTGFWARVDPNTDTFVARNFVSDTFNYNPYNHFQRPQERYFGGFFADYDLSDNVELYTEFMMMDNRTNSQIAPSGIFGYGVAGGNGGINCDNPFLSAQQVDFLCTTRGLSGSDIAGEGEVLILRRNVEGGLRNQDIRHTTYRGLMGFRGQVGDSPFNYDVSAMYSLVHRSDIYNNDLSIRKLSAALYAVDDGSGNIVCNINVDSDPTNDDPNCAPYDAFSGAGPSAAAVNYITSPLNRDGTVTQQVVNATITGDMSEYGWVMPWAESGVAIALGAEYRRDHLDSNPDANYQSGDGAGQGGPTLAIEGSIDVIDLFGEINIPLVQGREMVEELTVDAAYRRSEYTNASSDSYKFGIGYAPVQDVRFRASYQRAVRAPNIFELFSDQSIGLFDLSGGDPCGTTTPTATLAQCQNTGVTAAQYGNIANNPAGQYNTLGGGNPDLLPEESDTYTFGVVLEPSAIEGLVVSLDYFDISVDGFVGTVPEAFSLNQCLETGDSFYCGLINRGTGGTLWANNTGFITATNVNTGELSTKGVDLLASYSRPAGEFDLTFDLVGTYLDELITVPLPGLPADETYDCAGLYADNCGSPNPEWRHKFSTTLAAPGGWSVTGTWRYYDEVTASQLADDQPALFAPGAVDPIDAKLDAQNYLDVSAQFSLRDNASIRVGVNNITDEEPPVTSLAGTAPGNGNTYPQVYDAMGRYVFLGATLDF